MKGKTAKQHQPVFVVDTHSFYWFLQAPDRLSPAADAAFRLVEVGEAMGIVPAIVIAEIYYLLRKKSQNVNISNLINIIDETPNFILTELGREQLLNLDQADIPEMHDRLIAIEAIINDAAIITKDRELIDSGLVKTIW